MAHHRIAQAALLAIKRAAAALAEFDAQVQALAGQPMAAQPAAQLRVPPRTIEQFLDELAESDITIAEWARVNEQPTQMVYMICYGRLRGTRGKSRKVAEAMNIVLPPFNARGAAA